jgi:Tetratricopeptide repeat
LAFPAPLRYALVAVALLVAAWLVLSFRATDLAADGRAVVERAQSGGVSAAEVRRGLDQLRQSRRLSVDQDQLVDEAALLASAGQVQEGIAAVERVVADEPENLRAWAFLYVVSLAAREPERAERALAAVRELDPLLGARLASRSRPRP